MNLQEELDQDKHTFKNLASNINKQQESKQQDHQQQQRSQATTTAWILATKNSGIMPKPGSEGHGKSGHLSDRLHRKAPRRYFTFLAVTVVKVKLFITRKLQ